MVPTAKRPPSAFASYRRLRGARLLEGRLGGGVREGRSN